MKDKEVGELWCSVEVGELWCSVNDGSWLYAQMKGLIRKLVKERQERKHLYVLSYRNTYRPTQFRKGKKQPNPYYKWGEKEFLEAALRDFGIDPETWKGEG